MNAILPSVELLINKLVEKGNPPSESEIAKIEQAYLLAQKQHEHQKRDNGEPYFNHVFAAGYNCARFGMDSTLVIAGLLHDTLEDTDLDPEIIKQEFGEDVLHLVEGVTKLGKVKYRGNERHVESLRKFFVSVASDMRVVIVKLADRLHNLQTLEFVREDKRKRIALESIEIYAQLASRLGMGKIAGEIQDTAFPFAFPDEYEKVKKILESKKTDNEEVIKKVFDTISEHLEIMEIKPLAIQTRIKGTYSLFKKLVRKEWNMDAINDIVAIRVICNSIDECYRVLGIIHAEYRPVPGRIKDYIALPKPNGYQSLHTSVFDGDGTIVEVQIRTKEMHDFAEYGIASHHLYKRNQSKERSFKKDSFNWLSELSELETSGKTPSEFLKQLRTDFFEDRIFVYTPKGDVIDLPQGASMIDFAYAVHSDIGFHASGARQNGKYVALKTKVENGAVVEIITDKKARPSSKWLADCVTGMAQKHIRTYIQKHGGIFEKWMV